jgi:hypothetical protein
MISLRLLPVFAMLSLAPQLLTAQNASQTVAERSWTTWKPPALDTTTASVKKGTPDYRWEGAIVGGVVVGALGGITAGGICSDNGGDSCGLRAAGGVLFGGVVGVVVGGLIGSLFPKH